MRLLALPLLASMILGSGCATNTTTSDDPGGYETAARAHDVFADDFKNAGRPEQAKYHAEKARENRQQAIDTQISNCFSCIFIDAIIDGLIGD